MTEAQPDLNAGLSITCSVRSVWKRQAYMQATVEIFKVQGRGGEVAVKICTPAACARRKILILRLAQAAGVRWGRKNVSIRVQAMFLSFFGIDIAIQKSNT